MGEPLPAAVTPPGLLGSPSLGEASLAHTFTPSTDTSRCQSPGCQLRPWFGRKQVALKAEAKPASALCPKT